MTAAGSSGRNKVCRGAYARGCGSFGRRVRRVAPIRTRCRRCASAGSSHRGRLEGSAPATIENSIGVLERFLAMPAAWEAGHDDVGCVVASWWGRGMAPSTRRGYVQAFRDFHRFLVARKAAEMDATLGMSFWSPLALDESGLAGMPLDLSSSDVFLRVISESVVVGGFVVHSLRQPPGR